MSKDPYIVVVWGDSIAASGWPERAEQIHNVALNTGQPIKVINMGVGGMPATTATTQFEERVARHKPNLVIIQFGFNDLRYNGARGDSPISTPNEFLTTMRGMIKRCRTELGAKVVVFGNHRSRRVGRLPNGLSYEENNSVYRELSRSAARAESVRFVDLSHELQQVGFQPSEIVNEDGVHLSPTGLTNYAALAATVIMEEIRTPA